MKVFVVRLLCPLKHVALFSAFEAPEQDLLTDTFANTVALSIAKASPDLMNDGTRCNVCNAPRSEWGMEVSETKWDTLAEALPHLKEISSMMELLRRLELADVEHQKASQN